MDTLYKLEIVEEPDPDTDLRYLADDPERLAAYGDTWHAIGIYARAEIVVRGTVQTIRSAGLWGIESDSSADYLAAVREEESADLRDILAALGISA